MTKKGKDRFLTDRRRPAAAASGGVAIQKRVSVLSAFPRLCSIRACLGKMMIFSIKLKRRKKSGRVFVPSGALPAAVQPSPGRPARGKQHFSPQLCDKNATVCQDRLGTHVGGIEKSRTRGERGRKGFAQCPKGSRTHPSCDTIVCAVTKAYKKAVCF